jgi:glycyl-tRNA synthetase (class II)
LILPPKIAPWQVVIVPIYKGDEQKAMIDAKVLPLIEQLKSLGIRVKYDDNDNARPGWKFAEYEMKGVPVRLAIGARDLENNVVEVARRDTKKRNQFRWMALQTQLRTCWMKYNRLCIIKHWLTVLNILRMLTTGVSLKNCWMIKAVFLLHIGTVLPKQKPK